MKKIMSDIESVVQKIVEAEGPISGNDVHAHVCLNSQVIETLRYLRDKGVIRLSKDGWKPVNKTIDPVEVLNLLGDGLLGIEGMAARLNCDFDQIHPCIDLLFKQGRIKFLGSDKYKVTPRNYVTVERVQEVIGSDWLSIQDTIERMKLSKLEQTFFHEVVLNAVTNGDILTEHSYLFLSHLRRRNG